MHRQFPGRNQRSKGVTVKYFVQYSLLLRVCFWLLYQLKHSNEKSIHHDHEKTEASGLPERLDIDEIMKLGRKGIQETAVFKAKIEEGEAEFEENEGAAGGVEETEKNEKNGSDADDENKVEETESNEVHNLNEDETLGEEEVENVPEERENNYKADDASSAVTHDSQSRVIENENESSEENGNSIRNLEEEVTGSENGNSKSTVAEGSIDHLMSSNLTDLAVENDDVTAKNATGSSNSTVSTETMDPLDETVEEEDMATTEASDNSVIEDNSTSETNDEEDESERSDKDPIDDTDIPNETIDTIREVESGEEANTE